MHGVPVSLTTQQSADKDELFVCPYDPVHIISAKRFVPHIMKCKKNFPNVHLDTCPFNARHLFRPAEMRHHISICPDRFFVELDQYGKEMCNKAELLSDTPASNQYLDFGDDESWDEEIERNQSQRNVNMDSLDGGFPHSVRSSNPRVEAVGRIKGQLKEQLRRATDAQVLPSRRPAYSVNMVSEYSGAVGARGARASEDMTARFSRPRLAANFSNQPGDGASGVRGRGRFFMAKVADTDAATEAVGHGTPMSGKNED